MKILKLFLISLMTLIPFTVTSFAGNASTYIITVLRVQLLKDDGVTWVTIAAPNQEVDIAAAAQNTVAHAFSNITIPPGNYINFKIVNSETMRYSGSDQGFYTLAGGALTLTGDGTVNSTADWEQDPPQNNVTITETSNTSTNNANL